MPAWPDNERQRFKHSVASRELSFVSARLRGERERERANMKGACVRVCVDGAPGFLSFGSELGRTAPPAPSPVPFNCPLLFTPQVLKGFAVDVDKLPCATKKHLRLNQPNFSPKE